MAVVVGGLVESLHRPGWPAKRLSNFSEFLQAE